MEFEFFHFKDFSMRQSKTGQRINTDSVVFADQVLQQLVPSDRQLLDIGAGTGVLSLMLANEDPSRCCVAIEPDEDAFHVLKLNTEDRHWGGRISAVNVTLQDFVTHRQFDVIVCNPPFFTTGPRAQEKSRAIARHSDSLDAYAVAKSAKSLINKTAKIFILSNIDGIELWARALEENGLSLYRKILLADAPQSLPHAAVLCFTPLKMATKDGSSELHYRLSPGGPYTQEMEAIRSRWLRAGAK